ncbi:MAG: hypothetical protein JW847_09440 [Candidatus Omnitrophica bacterium]|nr:hypothetical protein [Candidatus Omnitrophota bacterium]
MQKKRYGYILAGLLCLTVILALSLNVMAAYQGQSGDDIEIPFKTDMSDRTMLKEILVNQGKIMSLLQEIKASVKEKK